jgi:hypothetical protein
MGACNHTFHRLGGIDDCPVCNKDEIERKRRHCLALLEPLFEKANRERKWFYWSHQGLMFSPKELRMMHARGEFIWAPSNWQLVDPPGMKDLDLEREKMTQYNQELKRKIDEGWES